MTALSFKALLVRAHVGRKKAPFGRRVLVREPFVRWTRASLRAAAAEGLHAQQCSPCKDACSLAGAVGIKAEVTLAQRAKVAEAKPSERSASGVKRA